MKQRKTHRLVQATGPALLGTIATALVTLVCYWVQPGAVPVALLYVFVVVLVSVRGDLVASIWVSLLATAALDYFFTAPLYRLFPVREARDLVALIAFLTTALVINQLIARMRQSFRDVKAAQDQLQLMIDTMPTFLTRTRPDGGIELVNQQWRDFLGLSLEDIRRGQWVTALHPDDRDRFVGEWSASLESGLPLESEARMRRADGEYRWLLIRVVPFRDRQGRIVEWYGTSTDVEDRRRAEERARLADRERRVLIDTIPALVWSTLPDGSGEFNNETWLKYTGLSAEAAEGWGYADVIHPEDYKRRTPLWRAAFAAGRAMEDEARLRRADGQYRWFLHRAVPLRDEQGNILKWIGTSTDIEDLKRAEGVLREQAGLLDLSHDTVFVRDMGDVITYWNRGAEALYGWSKDEAVGKSSHQLMQTVFSVPLDQANATLFDTDRWEGELVHTKRDGTQVVVASRWSLQRDEQGHPTAILETNNDVTERKRLDDELRRSQAFLIAAQELGNTGSWARRISTGEIYWSEEVFRIFGVDARTTTPHREIMSRLWHPEDRERCDRTIDEAIRSLQPYEMDARLVRPDGSVRHVHIRGQPVSHHGVVDEWLGVVMDITDRKRTERALRRARERALEARFAAVMEERTRLARDIHDTLLQGFTGIALKLVAVSSRVREPPESIAALQDLIRLAQQTLIDARRSVWDLRAPSLAGADLSAALRNVADDCVRGTELDLQYDVAGPARPMDPEIEAVMVRVLQEAITNAVKHAAARAVRVRLSFEGHRARLSIADDGRGFVLDPELRSYGGHWGLLGMRERAAQVEGNLSLRSAPGRGTQVVLRVPYALRSHSPAVQTSSSSS